MKHRARSLLCLSALTLAPNPWAQEPRFPSSPPSDCPGNLLTLPSGVGNAPTRRLISGDLDGDLVADLALLSGKNLAVLHSPAIHEASTIVTTSALDVAVLPGSAFAAPSLAYLDGSGLVVAEFDAEAGAFQVTDTWTGRGWPTAGTLLASRGASSTYFAAVASNGGSMVVTERTPTGFKTIGSIVIKIGATTHGIRAAVLLDWDADPAQEPEIALLSTYGMHVFTARGAELLRVAAPTVGDSIAAIRRGDATDALAWLTVNAGGAQELRLYHQTAPSGEQPAVLGVGRIYESLVAGDYDQDGDDDLLVDEVGSYVVALLDNSYDKVPVDIFSAALPRADIDLADGLGRISFPPAPIVWSSLYNEHQESGGPVSDLAVAFEAEKPGDSPFLRLVPTQPDPCGGEAFAGTGTNPPHPVITLSVLQSSAYACNPEPPPLWYCNDPPPANIALQVFDGWDADSQANGIELVVFQHTFPALPPVSDKFSVHHIVYEIPGQDWSVSVPPFILPGRVVPPTSGMTGPTIPEQWFGDAYIVQIRRVRLVPGTTTVLEAWKTYTLGYSNDGIIPFALTTYDTKGWLGSEPGANGFEIFDDFQFIIYLGIQIANPSTAAGSVPLTRKPALPPNNPVPVVQTATYGGVLMPQSGAR